MKEHEEHWFLSEYNDINNRRAEEGLLERFRSYYPSGFVVQSFSENPFAPRLAWTHRSRSYSSYTMKVTAP